MPASSLSRRSVRGRAASAALLVVTTVLVLAGAELLWRALVPETRAERDNADYIRTSLRYLVPCAKIETRAGERVIVGQPRGVTGGEFSFAAAKPAGVRRVAFAGESTGVMLGGAAVNLLQQSPDQPKWQIMNCAEGGVNLAHAERRAYELLEYSPDVVIVVFGHNWMMAPMPMHEWSLHAQSWLSRSRLIAGLANRLVPGGRPAVALDRTKQLARLEAFLRGIVRRGHEHGAVVILSTLTANLWFPPLIEEGTSADPDFAAAELDYARGRGTDAIAKLEALNTARPNPYWEFVLGTWLGRAGMIEPSATHLELALERESVEVDRATPAVNDLIRRVALEEGAVLRDTEREMRKVAAGGLPGWDVMRDHCHLQPSYVAEEAEALLELAAAESGDASGVRLGPNPFAADDVVRWMLDGLATVQSQLRDARSRRYQRALSYFVEHWARADPQHMEAAVADFLRKDVFAGLPPWGRTAVLVAIADGYEWAGLHAQALALNRSARDVAATHANSGGGQTSLSAAQPLYDATVWLQLGFLEIASRNAAAATDAFRQAQAVAPSRKDAAFLAGAAQRIAAE